MIDAIWLPVPAPFWPRARSRVELLAIARDDEQRVVDADSQTDHESDERREVRHLHEVADQDDERAAHPDAEERDADR